MLVKFTDHSGAEVWINPLQVRTVRVEQIGRAPGGYAGPGSAARGEARTLILLGSDRTTEVRVELPIQEVVKMLDNATPTGLE